MGRLDWFGVSIAVLVIGCMPSTEAKSAGQVGCVPDEITISDAETHFGLVQLGQTWVAECRGRRFVCSELSQSGSDTSMLASEQVSCREEAESPDAERKRHSAEAAALLAQARPMVSPAPTGAAGFDFGQTLEVAAERCSAAAESWQGSGERYACSGPAVSLGFKARIALRFCGGRICSIAVEQVPGADLNRSAVALKQQLETKYGPAKESQGTVPEQCRGAAAFARCASAQQVLLDYAWRWSTGESIEMSVGKLNESEPTAIRLVYRRPVHVANLTAL